MNLLEANVTKVLGKPFHKWEKWWIEVEYECYGRISKTELMFSTEEKANSVDIGFQFLC
jgi:hypothetical protein